MMLTCIFWLLVCFFAVGSVILAVDFYYWLVDRCCRYRIGRWEDKESWIARYNQVVLKWLPSAPAVQISDNTHLLLWDKITGKFSRGCVQSWQTAGLILGACEYKKNDRRQVVSACTDHFIDRTGMWKKKPTHVDNAMLAYSLLKYSEDKEFIKPAMDYMIYILNEHFCDEDGLITYNHNRPDLRYVDTLGLVCPFLVLYARTYSEPKYSKLASDQITKFGESGLYENSFLPFHAFEAPSLWPVGVFGWGRGTGWFVIAVMDSFLEMVECEERDKLKETITQMAEQYETFQRSDGGYGVFLQDKKTYDSSATAILAYFYACCFSVFQQEAYREVSMRAIEALVKNTRMSGKLDNCQGDTKDVGIFSTRFDILPFAQGMGLRAWSKLQELANE
jgi:unsaturated rhamnogalacturonyl hydrolase